MTHIYLVLMTLAWFLIAAITDHYLPWLSWHSEGLSTIALMFAYCAYLTAYPKNSRGDGLPVCTLPALIIWFAAAVQASTGILLYPIDIILLAIYLSQFILSCYLGYELMATNGERPQKVLTFAAVLFCAFGLVLAAEAASRALDAGWLSDWVAGVGSTRRPGSNLSQANHLATMLGGACVALLYLYLTKKIKAPLVVGAALILLMALSMTESRTGLVSILLLVIYAMGFNLMENRNDKIVVAVLLILFVVLFFKWPTIWLQINISDQTEGAVNLTTSGRMQLWREAVLAITQKPMAGWGYRQFAMAQMSVVMEGTNSLVATYAHNILLDFMVWLGIPATLVLTSLALFWMGRRVKAATNLESKILIAFLIPIGLHSLLEYPYTYTYFLIPAGFVIGAIDGRVRASRILKSWKIVSVGFVFSLFGLVFYSAYEYLRLEEDLRLARFASAKVGSDPVGHLDFNPIVLTQLSELVEVARYKPTCDIPEEDIDRIYRVSRYYPWLATLGKYAAVAKINNMHAQYVATMQIVGGYFGQGGVYKVEERIGEYEKLCRSIN